jgi:hypothetical protein
MACAAGLALWLSRGTTLWVDEITAYMESPGLGLEETLRPHLGHLSLTSRLTYKAVFEVFGANYVPFRVLTLLALILAVALLFAYLKRRVGGYVALAPCLVLLFFGSDYIHVLAGNGYTILLGIASGLGAFLALERDDRRGDLIACGLLCFGVVTYSFALGFLAGAMVWIAVGEDRRRRAWVVLVPLALYAAWWLWSGTLEAGPASEIDPVNLLVLPSWAFQSLSAVLTALTGVSYQFPGGYPAPQVGPVLAVIVLALVGLRFRSGAITKELWAGIAVLLSLWGLGALASGGIRFPENTRYFYPVGIGLMLIAADSLRGIRWSWSGILAVYLVALAGLGANLLLLRDGGGFLRETHAPLVRASFAALDVAGDEAEPTFDLFNADGSPGPGNAIFGVPFDIFEARDEAPVDAYLAAADRYGSFGFSLPELRARDMGLRSETDRILVKALGLELSPTDRRARGPGCRRVRGTGGRPPVARLPTGGALLELAGSGGQASLGRFADAESAPLGRLAPSEPALLRIPPDNAPDPWRLSVAGSGTLIVCPLG